MSNIERRDDLYLNLESLSHVQVESRTARVRSEIYNKILDTVLRKIRRFAQKKTTCCTYQPPSTMIGMPLYPYEEMIAFLLREIALNGIRVERLDYNTIWISWSKEDLNWEQYQKFMQTRVKKDNKAIPLKEYREGRFKEDLEFNDITSVKHLRRDKPDYLDFL